MRILGIDHGDKKVGFCMSDLLGLTAQPLEVLRYKNKKELFDRVSLLVTQHDVKKIVVGLPKNMDGTIGFRGEKTMEFVEALKSKLPEIEIVTWDERLTTTLSKRVMIETGVKRKNKEKVEDKIAAVFILQSFLDSGR